LRGKQSTTEYQEWFLKYTPGEGQDVFKEKKKIKKNTSKTVKNKKKTGSENKILKLFGL